MPGKPVLSDVKELGGEDGYAMIKELNETIHLASDIKAKQELQDLHIMRYDNKLRISAKPEKGLELFHFL